MSIPIDDVIATYMKLRDKKAAIEAEAKDRVAEIKAKMEKIEAYVKVRAETEGVTSFKTPHGTAFLSTTDYAQVADWDSFIEFVRTEDAYEMLEKRVSKTAVREYIEQTKNVPPGVNYGTRLEVNFRKPSAGSET